MPKDSRTLKQRQQRLVPPANDDPRVLLARRIKQLRGVCGLTQEEVAERSGIFRTYLSRIEAGQANPTLTMLYQLAAAFPVEVTELLTVTDDPIPQRVMATLKVSRGRAAR